MNDVFTMNLMKTCLESVIADKRCLLVQRMADDAGVGDPGLANLMLTGVKLTGVGGYSPLFEPLDDAPALDDRQLMKSSRWSRRMILGKSSGQHLDTRDDV